MEVKLYFFIFSCKEFIVYKKDLVVKILKMSLIALKNVCYFRNLLKMQTTNTEITVV